MIDSRLCYNASVTMSTGGYSEAIPTKGCVACQIRVPCIFSLFEHNIKHRTFFFFLIQGSLLTSVRGKIARARATGGDAAVDPALLNYQDDLESTLQRLDQLEFA